MIEIFSGAGHIAQAFQSRGFETITLDKRKRKGVCEPDIRADFLQHPVQWYVEQNATVLWFGLPCTTWSYAPGDFHRKNGRALSPQARESEVFLLRTIEIIEKSQPAFWFIENPRGHLRHNEIMQHFLARTSGVIYDLYLYSYGFPTQKPTNIFTNMDNFITRPPVSYGRGAKSPRSFKNMTTVQRQATPIELGYDIADFVLLNL